MWGLGTSPPGELPNTWIDGVPRLPKNPIGGLRMVLKKIPDRNQTNKGMIFMNGITNDVPTKPLVLGEDDRL